MEYIDMHVHSTYSDGTCDIKTLARLASEVPLKAMALTDHDTVEGIDEAIEEFSKYDIEIIPGVELSARCDFGPRKGHEIHILGFFIDYNNAHLCETLDSIVFAREERNKIMCQRLSEHGLNVTYEELKERFPGTIVARPHFARILMEKGYVNDIKKAFDKYIGDTCPCYVEREHISPKEAIDAIHEAGGIAFLAHPLLYKLERDDVKALVHHLKSIGLDGLEALYSTHTQGDEIFIRTIAKNEGLKYSGGSDFHGDNKPYIKLGVGKGGLKVGYHVLENIRE